VTAHSDQSQQLDRVSTRIATALVAFWSQRLRESPVFVAADVLAHIKTHVGEVAPDSPGRIMRDLRARGQVAYEVVSRAESRYRALPLPVSEAAAPPVPARPAVSPAVPALPWRPAGMPVTTKPQLDLFGRTR
jgi:hypothetical protein